MTRPTLASSGHWLLPCAIVLVSFIIELCGDYGRQVFAYTNDFLEDPQYWRALTGHLSHLGWSHFLLNVFGFCGVWWLYGKCYQPKVWAMFFLLICLGISACFFIFDPEMPSYVGLSGVLHGLLIIGAGTSLLRTVYTTKNRPLEDFIVITAICLKIIYEQSSGAVPVTEFLSGGPVVVNAHFYGAICGTLCLGFAIARGSYREKS